MSRICSGVVAAVGARAAHVPALHVGQAVLGLAGGSLGTYVAAFQDMAVPMPSSLSFEQAATAPTVFVTVELALHRASAVHAGDNVLVHGGTGGVGLAATQVATAAGASAPQAGRCAQLLSQFGYAALFLTYLALPSVSGAIFSPSGKYFAFQTASALFSGTTVDLTTTTYLQRKHISQ